MPKINDPSKKKDFMALFIGRPGHGKSVAAASFVEAHKEKSIYIADLDGRVESVRQSFGGKYGNQIDYDTYSVKDFTKLNKKLDDLVLNCPYNAVIFDGYTSLADMLMQYSMDLRGKEYTNTQGNRGIIDIADLQDYKAESNGLMSFMMKLRAITCPYKIVTAHVLVTQYFNTITQKETVIKSILTAGKKVTDKVPAYFDEIWEFYIKDHTSMGKAPYYKMTPIASEDNVIKTAIGMQEVDFTRSPTNPDGSLFKMIRPQLEKAGFVS